VDVLARLGMRSIRELRGKTNVLYYLADGQDEAAEK
jgi:glutamate synthase domain-containing protein 2